MCEANVYCIDKKGNEKLFLEAVDKVIPMEEGLLFENIFSERKIIKGKIKEMALVAHRIVVEEE